MHIISFSKYSKKLKKFSSTIIFLGLNASNVCAGQNSNKLAACVTIAAPQKNSTEGLATTGNLVHAPYPRTHDMNKRYRSE
jgi:hypothetical protein